MWGTIMPEEAQEVMALNTTRTWTDEGKTARSFDKCHVCNEPIDNTQPHVMVEYFDSYKDYKTFRVRIHKGVCYLQHLKVEEALVVIKKHLWDKHQIVANEEQLKEVVEKIKLAEYIKNGKTIEWAWGMKYFAEIFDESPDGAKSFVENDLSNQVEFNDIEWTPKWQLLD